MSDPSPFRYFRTSPEIIRLAVTLYARFPVSLLNVEDLLHERGVDVSHETVRFRCLRFGPMFAAETRKRRIDGMRACSPRRRRLYEVFVNINGVRHYPWRVVDHKCEVVEAVGPKRCGKRASLKLLRKPMKRYGPPREIVTDRPPFFGAALKALGAQHRQGTGRWRSDRAGNPHLPRRRRERPMQRIRRMRGLQTIAAVHASVSNHFNQDRSLSSRPVFKDGRAATIAEWRQLGAA